MKAKKTRSRKNKPFKASPGGRHALAVGAAGASKSIQAQKPRDKAPAEGADLAVLERLKKQLDEKDVSVVLYIRQSLTAIRSCMLSPVKLVEYCHDHNGEITGMEDSLQSDLIVKAEGLIGKHAELKEQQQKIEAEREAREKVAAEEAAKKAEEAALEETAKRVVNSLGL